VHRDYEGDTSFPEINYSEWQEVAREEFSKGEEYDSSFTFIDLERVK
jgi:dihydrofolate reductase